MNNIKFILSTDKAEYLLGEPVVIYLELSNIGTQSTLIIDLLDPKYEFVNFYIKKEKEEKLFKPYVVADSLLRTRSLKPAESIKETAKIFYGSKGWTFNTIGKYLIRATYNNMVNESERKLESNVVEVNIQPPKNEQEKEQVHLIMGDEQGLFLLFEGGDHLLNGITNLTRLSNKYPMSVLAGYANYALGVNYSKDFKDFQKGIVRKAEIERSITHLENAKILNNEKYFAKQTYFTLSDVYKKSNNNAAAKETLNEFIQKFSNNEIHTDNIIKARNLLNEID